MEAFEKWRDEQKISGRSYKADARIWQAALEWVKTKAVADDYGYSIGLEHIEQELEN